MKRGKRYQEAAKLIEPNKPYPPDEGIKLAKKTALAKFDETVELHLRTGLDPRHADQQLRGTTILPHGLGKTVRVLVFAEGEAARFAEEAGADFYGGDDLIKRVEGGWTEFDVALASREIMGKVGRLGRVLGPRGLMPNPRSGTVVEPQDIGRAVRDAREGRGVPADRTALVHPIGKASFRRTPSREHGCPWSTPSSRQSWPALGQYIRSASRHHDGWASLSWRRHWRHDQLALGLVALLREGRETARRVP
jgi:large subunit ribosomal protein L1